MPNRIFAPIAPGVGAQTAPIQAAPALTEIAPSAPGDALAAFGFALAWALSHAEGLILWAFPERLAAEYGALHAEGLAQFGADLERVLFVRAPNQTDALWAAEQALNLPGSMALCTIEPASKSLSLTATRRLLLLSEKHQSRCVLTRLDPLAASAAGLRFSVRAAPSAGANRELGPPAFDVRLTRNRAGPAGQSWRLIWSPHDRALIPAAPALDGDLAQPAFDRPAAPHLRRAL